MSELTRVAHGLWRPPAAVADLAATCATLLEVLPPEAVFVGRTAAALHGLWMPDSKHRPVDVALARRDELPREYAHSERSEIRTRRRTYASWEMTTVARLPVTIETRTWVDLAEELSVPDLVACGDSVLRAEAPPPLPIEEMVLRARRQRGVRRARQALGLLDRDSRSRPESHMRVAFVLGGLPKPRVNKAVYNSDHEWLYEPDVHWEEPRLSFDYQGADHAETMRMRRDITRGLGVEIGEWNNVYLGPAEVFGRPWELAPIARTLIERRAPGWLREWRENGSSGGK